MTAFDLRSRFREVPDFPEPGIGFKDIAPLLLDPVWGAPPPVTAIAKAVPFIDMTDDYERSIRGLGRFTLSG